MLPTYGVGGPLWGACVDRRRHPAFERTCSGYTLFPLLEPPTGFGPALSAWKAEVLPLHHGDIWGQMWESNPRLKAYETCDLTVCPIYQI